jgi:hypothetical protein
MHDIFRLLNVGGKSKDKQDHKIDIVKLREMCVTKHGLVNQDIRKLVWPILLNAEALSGKQVSDLKQDISWLTYGKMKHKESS